MDVEVRNEISENLFCDVTVAPKVQNKSITILLRQQQTHRILSGYVYLGWFCC
jgi:AICAR transformylase/IMP cyclohydrolase PurH